VFVGFLFVSSFSILLLTTTCNCQLKKRK